MTALDGGALWLTRRPRACRGEFFLNELNPTGDLATLTHETSSLMLMNSILFHPLVPLAVVPGGSWPFPWPRMLATSFTSQEVIAIIAIIGALCLTAFIIGIGLYMQNRKRQMWHETARLALEKGQPMPPAPMSDEELEHLPPPGMPLKEWEELRRARSQAGDFKAGLILIAIGVGLAIMRPGGQMVGVIPALMGVALFINALIERLSSRRTSSPEKPPTQS